MEFCPPPPSPQHHFIIGKSRREQALERRKRRPATGEERRQPCSQGPGQTSSARVCWARAWREPGETRGKQGTVPHAQELRVSNRRRGGEEVLSDEAEKCPSLPAWTCAGLWVEKHMQGDLGVDRACVTTEWRTAACSRPT